VTWKKIRQRFYGVSAKSHAQTAMFGCQLGSYVDIRKHIKASVLEVEVMSPGSTVNLLRKAIEYGVGAFKGMAQEICL
jgi:hypothetical protein